MSKFHDQYIGHNNHAITANPDDLSYADIEARDDDTAWHVTGNINKVVRVESPLSFWLLTSIGPATWVEFTGTVGSGDVVGPTSSIDNVLARFDGVTGKLLQNSDTTLSNTGQLNIVGSNARLHIDKSADPGVGGNFATLEFRAFDPTSFARFSSISGQKLNDGGNRSGGISFKVYQGGNEAEMFSIDGHQRIVNMEATNSVIMTRTANGTFSLDLVADTSWVSSHVRLRARGQNDAGVIIDYGTIEFIKEDDTAGAIEGSVLLRTVEGNSLSTFISFNEDQNSQVKIYRDVKLEKKFIPSRKVSGASNMDSSDAMILGVTDTAAVRTVTMLTADILAGGEWTIKDESGGAGTNNITIATEGSETIDGQASLVISQNYGSMVLYSDLVNLFVRNTYP